jgi:DNA-binding NarL/FixJ family response regulator
MSKLEIVLVDDHVMVREGLRHLLLTFKNIEVVGEAGDGQEAIALIREKQPDVVILDLSMPKLSGVDAIGEIKKIAPDTQILILSMYANEEYIRQTMKSGASGYLLKQSASEELKAALHFIANGQIYLSPAISKSVVHGWLSPKASGATDAEKGLVSKREKQIIKLLAEGYSNKKIAEQLFISVKTVETHRHHIMEKLELDSFAALVKYAIKEKIIENE